MEGCGCGDGNEDVEPCAKVEGAALGGELDHGGERRTNRIDIDGEQTLDGRNELERLALEKACQSTSEEYGRVRTAASSALAFSLRCSLISPNSRRTSISATYSIKHRSFVLKTKSIPRSRSASFTSLRSVI